jgi:hypothetical protein
MVPMTKTTSPASVVGEWAIPIGFLAAAVAFYVYGTTLGWKQPIGGPHEFRQAQTILPCQEMVKSGLTLSYQTPVLGPPWEIPFEFPLYQWAVTIVNKVAGVSITEAGRGVSVLFFLFTLIPLDLLLQRHRIDGKGRMLALAFFLVNPFYIFWGRSVMLESTALCLSVWYYYLATRREQGGWRGLAAAICGALAALVKVTTVVPALVGVAVVLVSKNRSLLPDIQAAAGEGPILHNQQIRARGVALLKHVILFLVIPVIAGAVWTHLADGHKINNPIARHLTSGALSAWNFGTWSQKLSLTTWTVIAGRTGALISYNVWVWLGVMAILWASRQRQTIDLYALMFVSAPLVFTNLYYEHSYYFYANGVWLLLAIAIAIADLVKRHPFWNGAVLILGLSMMVFYWRLYKVEQETSYTERQGRWKATFAQTKPDSVIVMLGFDWSAIIPFYAERRALMIPEWDNLQEADVRRALIGLKKYELAGVLIHEPSRYGAQHLLQTMHEVGLHPTRVLVVQ